MRTLKLSAALVGHRTCFYVNDSDNYSNILPKSLFYISVRKVFIFEKTAAFTFFVKNVVNSLIFFLNFCLGKMHARSALARIFLASG